MHVTCCLDTFQCVYDPYRPKTSLHSCQDARETEITLENTLASRSSMGLANAVAGAADSLEYGGRVRPPRPPSLDGLLRAYDSHAARGLDVMRRFDGGRYRADLFVSFLVLQVCFLSAHKLISLVSCALTGICHPHWPHPHPDSWSWSPVDGCRAAH